VYWHVDRDAYYHIFDNDIDTMSIDNIDDNEINSEAQHREVEDDSTCFMCASLEQVGLDPWESDLILTI